MTDAALAALYAELGRLGLALASSGNVSARRGPGLAITATGVRADQVGAADIVTLDAQGRHQGTMLPSSEWQMHAAIYHATRDAKAPAQVIVHTHSDAAVALSCLRCDLPPFHYMLAEFGGDDVRCSRYELFGTPALAEAARVAIEGRTACLLANHGMICHGPDAAAALTTALRLETLARQYLLALAAGPPVLLSPEQMRQARQRYASYGQQPGDRQ